MTYKEFHKVYEVVIRVVDSEDIEGQWKMFEDLVSNRYKFINN